MRKQDEKTQLTIEELEAKMEYYKQQFALLQVTATILDQQLKIHTSSTSSRTESHHLPELSLKQAPHPGVFSSGGVFNAEES